MGRREAPWVVGTIAVGVACLGVAVWLTWWGSALFGEADAYYRSQTGAQPVPEAVDRYYSSLMHASYAMHDVVGPLLAGAVFAVLATVAVLALGWTPREEDAP